MPPYLVLDQLDKSFGDNRVLAEISLAVDKGEILALLGPSGSGKTTVLRCLAGFEAPDSGAIRVEGKDLTRLPPERRNFGMVFQHYALFPHLTVGQNVAFGLEGRDLPRKDVERRVTEALALVDLPDFAGRRVGEISGGQQQRVALARALAPEPRVLLLDEPLSNLDPSLRERTRRELRRAIRRVGITTVLVTHEQEEAFHLGDRVAVLWGGVLQQVGTPEDLYERPATRFVATFVGRASALPGAYQAPQAPQTMAENGGAVLLPVPDGTVAWPGLPGEELAAGESVELVVRPESLRFVRDGAPALSGRVRERRFGGPVTYYLVSLASGGEVEVLAGAGEAAPGEAVQVAPDPAGPPPRIFRRRPA
jgi:ABC-type Fe3+/spermidine/putrescine transport system ATPase subunit